MLSGVGTEGGAEGVDTTFVAGALLVDDVAVLSTTAGGGAGGAEGGAFVSVDGAGAAEGGALVSVEGADGTAGGAFVSVEAGGLEFDAEKTLLLAGIWATSGLEGLRLSRSARS